MSYRFPILSGLTCGDAETMPHDCAFEAARALHWYCVEHHGGQSSDLYALQCALRYTPGILERDAGDNSDDTLAVWLREGLEEGDFTPEELYAEIVSAHHSEPIKGA